MKATSDSIPKNPELKAAEDYYRLRREGIGFLEKLTSSLWTDYNTHDPGITILENLCYALTDLAYRSGWDINDLLAPEQIAADPKQPYPGQAFFTARDILTVNPVTADDFQRVLIDLPGIRNAWVTCKTCACDLPFYAECKNGQLQLTYQRPEQTTAPIKVTGLYDIALELEADLELGDLNDQKINQSLTIFDDDGNAYPVLLELHFPQAGRLLETSLTIAMLTLKRFGSNKTDDILTKTPVEQDTYLRKHWRAVFYLDAEVKFSNNTTFAIQNAALRISGSSTAKANSHFDDIKSVLETVANSGFISPYQAKLDKAKKAIQSAKAELHKYRNLAEDYCHIAVVGVEEVTVCADIEVAADADIERVQAAVWFAIENYFNPPVPFYSLAELQAENIPVEDIFKGPELSNGFIKAKELARAELKTVLRTSDIINSLMDLKEIGLIAVNNLLLSKYDAAGQVVKGAADPEWDSASQQFKLPPADKASATWLLLISAGHQPRLNRRLSRFLFFKDSLPFIPRQDEANDIIAQLQGADERPKINAQQDIPIPTGTYRQPDAYYPVQYGFPLTYGIGVEGLPAHASAERRAQAQQLKAYLLVFEQLLANALSQLGHTADLFSLDAGIKHSYFAQLLDIPGIKKLNSEDVNSLTDGLDQAALDGITETETEAYARRNRFLNHLLARFGEQFSEYALMLSHAQGRQKAAQRLIDDKLAFLKAYPVVSHDRGKAFNYTVNPRAPANFSGLKKRVSLLLGYPDLKFNPGLVVAKLPPKQFDVNFELTDPKGKIWLAGELNVEVDDNRRVKYFARIELLKQMTNTGNYLVDPESGQYRLKLKDMGQCPDLLNKSEALALKDELVAWVANERAVIVEHLLLRPKFPGDALYPVCSEGKCKTCDDADPYSHRLTWVMPGWTALYNNDMDMRRFAERSIQQETPAHLLGKVCWVGNDNFNTSVGNFVLNELFEKLRSAAVFAADTDAQILSLTNKIIDTFAAKFQAFYAGKQFERINPDDLSTQLAGQFALVNENSIDSNLAALWPDIQKLLLSYFTQLAVAGWQFERFLAAWENWLEVNAQIDWPEQRLTEQIMAILAANLTPGLEADLCQCSAKVLAVYGQAFYDWMAENVHNYLEPEYFPAFIPPTPAKLLDCSGLSFKSAPYPALLDFLNSRYANYKEVSYRLWLVLQQLAALNNTYPEATLHDCDDGSDQNPVRLGFTALGTLSLP